MEPSSSSEFTTLAPIQCLIDWYLPKCRVNQPPRFASNYDVNHLERLRIDPRESLSMSVEEETSIQPITTTPSQTSTTLTTLLSKATKAQKTIEPVDDGFFTPQLPTAVTASRQRVHPTTPSLERSTPSPQFLIETTARVSPFTVYPPVRPTTPMGTDPLGTTTMKPASGEDFPRTMLIMVGSGTVIVLIAAIVFCVFKCRQNAPPSEHYPMVMNGKSTGYAPISQEMSPQMIHHGDPSTQPLIAPRINTQVNGYQPIKGSVIPNGMNGDSPNGTPGGGGGMNGVNGMNGTGPRRINGGMNGSMNGLNGATNGNGPKATAKKKDFKEWYV
ncbi:unnamed protein product, partial [Mesorhabditis belari]|uniref:Uncharacterized protein n=1 Tax=Mesorhabditis belari TaxID=2138241 RepID=A0AAF3FQI7_9BILA